MNAGCLQAICQIHRTPLNAQKIKQVHKRENIFFHGLQLINEYTKDSTFYFSHSLLSTRNSFATHSNWCDTHGSLLLAAKPVEMNIDGIFRFRQKSFDKKKSF